MARAAIHVSDTGSITQVVRCPTDDANVTLERNPDRNASDDERHICCTLTSVLLRLVQESGGDAAVEQLLHEADTSHNAYFLSQPDNWVSLEEVVSLLETAQRLIGDAGLARRVGEHAVRQHAGTQVATLLRSLGSPEAILANIALAGGKFSTVTDLTAVRGELRPLLGHLVSFVLGRRPRLLGYIEGL